MNTAKKIPFLPNPIRVHPRPSAVQIPMIQAGDAFIDFEER